jgi:hypothetical protein
MRRPILTRQALGLIPLKRAGRADAPGIERVPLMAAGAEPFVFSAWRPAAERASDAGAGWVEAPLLIRLAIQDSGLVIGEGAHASIL